MIVFPNCKINLGLHILEKRADGYHNIETIFYPVPLHDSLEIITGDEEDIIEFSQSGLDIHGDPNSNLCIKAIELLKNEGHEIPGIKMHLHKSIPMGAGLGGGSADGAYTLKLLNEKYHLHIPIEKLNEYALALGSDCPFFIHNYPALGAGRGEKLSSLNLDLKGYYLAVVNPNIHVSTADAFAGCTPNKNRSSLVNAISEPIEHWKENLHNDFETTVFEKYPAIKSCKEKMYKLGAVYASMSGSGSSVYGLFKSQPTLQNFPASYYTEVVKL
jgi:4-diphosphocytidyl-2-C-methyl-D-erythritol kinase